MSEMPFMLFPTIFILLLLLFFSPSFLPVEIKAGKFEYKLLCNYLVNSEFCYFLRECLFSIIVSGILKVKLAYNNLQIK